MLPNQSTVNRNINTDTFWRQETKIIQQPDKTTLNAEMMKRILELRVWMVTECQAELEALDKRASERLQKREDHDF